MAVPVQYQKKGKAESMGQAGTVIGGVAGAYFGGPQGAIKGAQLGGSIGGAAGQAFDAKTAGPESTPLAQDDPTAPQAAPQEDPEKTLLRAQMALKDATPEEQQQYGPAIQSALFKLRRERQA